AGPLRLTLAQYRELAAFSQFASDLDASTRGQLERGERLMEVIKQGINVPLSVVKQVAIIYAGVNGFLDDIDVDKIPAFEVHLHESLDSAYADFCEQFNHALAMTDDIKEQLEKLLEEVKRTFNA
ncbi:MAG: F0F1 ATP synthase subunit alpha, partial [Pirellulaceae bacterium]|nr:F0F1 ATP synthase subunit alpha [Pirellulaceae bacterium]